MSMYVYVSVDMCFTCKVADVKAFANKAFLRLGNHMLNTALRVMLSIP